MQVVQEWDVVVEQTRVACPSAHADICEDRAVPRMKKVSWDGADVEPSRRGQYCSATSPEAVGRSCAKLVLTGRVELLCRRNASGRLMMGCRGQLSCDC